MQTWSAPAAKCASIRLRIASTSPQATMASISRSLPSALAVFLGEAETEKVVGVVRQGEIQGKKGASNLSCLRRIALQHDGLFDAQQRTLPQNLARRFACAPA